LNNGGINIDFTHVIDDDSHSLVLPVVQDMAEQSGLASTEKPG
jgi:hypothetical protein